MSPRADRFARTRCSVLRSIRSSWARSVMFWPRLRAQRRNSATSGVASYQPARRGRTDSAVVDQRTDGGRCARRVFYTDRHRWPRAPKNVEQRMWGRVADRTPWDAKVGSVAPRQVTAGVTSCHPERRVWCGQNVVKIAKRRRERQGPGLLTWGFVCSPDGIRTRATALRVPSHSD